MPSRTIDARPQPAAPRSRGPVGGERPEPGTPSAPGERARPDDGAIAARFYSLDVLRGCAALAVVLFHWQHFFYQGTSLPPFPAARQPFFALLKPFYVGGGRAVELFFSLSGFIFFWLYADSIARRRTTATAFAMLRLSRLYPLHFATLVFVAVAQAGMLHALGSWFVYGWNDAYHFVLQLGMAGNWGLQRGDSFNGPTWSVSVEVELYALFFLTCRAGLRRWWQLLLIAGAGFAITHFVRYPQNEVGTGVLCFYLGGVAFAAYEALRRRRPPRAALAGLVAVVATLWIVVPLGPVARLADAYRAHVWASGFAPHAIDVAGHAVEHLSAYERYEFDLVLFPLTILTLALWESARGTLGRRFRAISDVSYSSYLLHFPLQLVFLAGALALGLPRAVFYAPAALLAFFAVLVPLSLASYARFERPAQQWLRARYVPDRPAARTRGRRDEPSGRGPRGP